MDDKRTFSEQIRFVLGQALSDIPANLGLAMVVMIVYWPVCSHTKLLTWYGIMIIGAIARFLISFNKTRGMLHLHDDHRWFKVYLPLTSAFGLLWGAAGILFFVPDQLEYQLFIAILLAGIVSGAVSSLPVFLSVYYIFLYATMVPVTSLLLNQETTLGIAMGIICCFYIFYLSISAHRSHHLILDAISSRFKTELLARIDVLTGIPNRRSFNDTLYKELSRAQRNQSHITLIMIDIDYFKAINDNLGHTSGDAVLTGVAQSLAKTVSRPGDFVARYGGEEFSIILSETDEKGAAMMANKLREQIESEQFHHPNSSCGPYVTISAGFVSLIPEHSCAIEVLIEQADKALYAAKEAGRNTVKQANSCSGQV